MPNIIEIKWIFTPRSWTARLTPEPAAQSSGAEKGIFIARSPKVISRALDAGYQPLSLLMERKQITWSGVAEILTRCCGLLLFTRRIELLAALTALNLPGAFAPSAVRHPVPWKNLQNARRVAVLRALWILPTWGHLSAVQRPSTWMRCSSRPPLLRPAVPPGGAREHGCGVPGALGADRHTPADWPEKGMEQLHALGFKNGCHGPE